MTQSTRTWSFPCLTASLVCLATLLDASRIPAGEITNDGSLGTMSLNFNFRFEPTPAEVDDVKVALQEASEILCDAFESPAVNVQVNVAIGLGMLGKTRIGKGRKALEGARTGGWERTRIAVFNLVPPGGAA